ncbi:methylaspartate mutase [Actinacidiphila rubida]|nr:methylaspartate mutase [Actinacidiphila rubida]
MLVVQPRMGMGDPARMRKGLLATRSAAATTVGTITLDSYTRLGETGAARRALTAGEELNGYPITVHPPGTTRGMLAGVMDDGFPVQVRHGSALPEAIFALLPALGLHASEGGPVSYCLPYSRTPLREAVRSWRRCCELLVAARDGSRAAAEPHMETFGGCMLGQLCPPGLLVAISVLEALFFRQAGLRCLSLSYAQQANAGQDAEALAALGRLAGELLTGTDWHIVLYAYMGVFPQSPGGAQLLLDEAARLAVRSGAARLVVKTTSEAHRIPTVAENVLALETAAAVADHERRAPPGGRATADTGVYAEARALVDAVLGLSPDVGEALVAAFAKGYLDIPYCLHPDNAGRTGSRLDADGRLHWSSVGSMPIRPEPAGRGTSIGSAELLDALSYVRRTFDERAFDLSAVSRPPFRGFGEPPSRVPLPDNQQDGAPLP